MGSPLSMTHSHIQKRESLPYPHGWYAVCLSKDVKPGAVLPVPFMGGEIVVYRTESGLVRVINPGCPHLGTHLGHGGKVVGEHLVCPFHKLKYSLNGECALASIKGGQAGLPRLTHWLVREVNHAIFVWFDSTGKGPRWELPEFDDDGYFEPLINRAVSTGYVHDVAENQADIAHFQPVHRVRPISYRVDFNGPYLEGHVECRIGKYPFNFITKYFGLGYLVGDLEFLSFGLTARQYTMITPEDQFKYKITSIDMLRFSWLHKWPKPLRYVVYKMFGFIFKNWYVFVNKGDLRIWDKRYFVHHPKVTGADGPIHDFRKWSAQFYPPGAIPPPVPDARPVSSPSAAGDVKQGGLITT